MVDEPKITYCLVHGQFETRLEFMEKQVCRLQKRVDRVYGLMIANLASVLAALAAIIFK
ncbi:MAG: hypothetical protein ACE5K8_04630 [Candidatus Zixiibacteriota bacterium]